MALVPCLDILASMIDRVEVQTILHANFRRPLLPLDLGFQGFGEQYCRWSCNRPRGKLWGFGEEKFLILLRSPHVYCLILIFNAHRKHLQLFTFQDFGHDRFGSHIFRHQKAYASCDGDLSPGWTHRLHLVHEPWSCQPPPYPLVPL